MCGRRREQGRRLDKLTLRYILAMKSVHNDPGPEILKEMGSLGHIHYPVKSYRWREPVNCVFDKYVLSVCSVPHTVRYHLVCIDRTKHPCSLPHERGFHKGKRELD